MKALNILSTIICYLFVFVYAPSIQAQHASIDSTFGINGIVSSHIDTNSQISAMVVQPDGKIIACGYSSHPSYTGFALVRYKTEGALDSTFGINGCVLPTSNQATQSSAVVLQSDGKIIVAGRFILTGSSYYNIGLMRFNSNGTIDSSYGINGITTIAPGLTYSIVKAAVIQPDDKLVIAGYTMIGNTGENYLVARFKTNGSLDSTFGTNGITTTKIGSSSENDEANSIALQPDGKIILGGETLTPANNTLNFSLARYKTNGTLDATFGSGGKVRTTSINGTITCIGLQSTGKIVAAGAFGWGNGPSDFARVRYNANGSYDTTFAAVTFGGSSNFDEHFSMIIEPNDKILLGGNHTAFSITDIYFSLIRLHADGKVDSDFYNGYLNSIANLPYNYQTAMAVQPNHRILIGGSAKNSNSGASEDYTIMGFLPGIDTPFVASCNLLLTDSIVQPTHNTANGQIQVFVTINSGPTPYEYRRGINGTWQASNLFSNLSAGRDTIYVKDSTGCIKSIAAILINPLASLIEPGSEVISASVYPNPNTGQFILRSNGLTNPEYSIYDMLGRLVSRQIIRFDQEQVNMTDAAGVYTLIVKGEAGQSDPVRFVVNR